VAASLLVSCRPRLDRFPYPATLCLWTMEHGLETREGSLPLVGFRVAILPKGFGRGDRIVSSVVSHELVVGVAAIMFDLPSGLGPVKSIGLHECGSRLWPSRLSIFSFQKHNLFF